MTTELLSDPKTDKTVIMSLPGAGLEYGDCLRMTVTASSVASSSSSSVSESESRMTQGSAKKRPEGSGRPTTVQFRIDEGL